MNISSQCKKPFSILLTVVLLLTGIFPGIPLISKAYADGPITVAQAIANNSGQATVEGYIVGFFQSNSEVIFDTSLITSDTNLALADTSAETDVAKLLPIQLTTEYRSNFGLGTNKGLKGTVIRVTGSLEAYYTPHPGLKSPTNIEFVNVAPNVTASPTSGTLVAIGSTVTLSTSVTASVYYSVYANGSPTATFENQLYTTPIQINEDLVIKAYSSVPDKENSAMSTFTYTAQEALNLTISEIQGSGHASPYTNQLVNDVEGIVTFIKDSSTFYIQSDTPDNNNDTSEAIMVYKPSHGLTVGDSVLVSGQIKEWKESGYADAADLLTTEISANSVALISPDNPIPDPIILGIGGRILPTQFIDNDPLTFNPVEDALDFFESLEGMRVQLNTPKIIGPYQYEIPVIVDNGTSNMDEVYSSAGGLVITGTDFNPQRILIASQPTTPIKTGQQFTGNITGIMSYDYSNYKVRPEGMLPSVTDEISTNREVTSIVYGEDKLTVASFNVENFSKKSGTTKINNIADAITKNLNTPDIIGLLEVQDNDGSTNSGTVDASESYETLITAIKELDGPEYAYTDIAPVNNTDGGAPGSNIRVGFLYNPARVSLAPGAKGDATTAVTYDLFSGLSHNPGRIDPTNTAFNSSRKPLAAEFEFNGKSVVVIANHFNSKTGDSALFGSIQPPVMESELQRAQIAGVVNGFVDEILTKDASANVVVLGDLNDFQFSNTLNIVKGDELTNLVDTLPENDRYSYVYQGNSQTLDHILVNNGLASSSLLDIVHINADFMVEDGRVSDHDPLLAQIDLSSQNFKLRVLHTNDTHSHLETVVKRMTAIKQEKTSNSILLDAGDVFSGTLYFTKFEGLADLEFMNYIGYDAMVFGNHEFDRGLPVLRKFIDKANFPFISSNIDFTSQDNELKDIFESEIGGNTQENPVLDGHIYPAVIHDVYGEKVGIFGLTTEDTVGLSSPGNKITFEDYKTSAENTVKMLQDQGVNKIIALTHLGYTMDEQLAAQVPGIDVIVGGHSHTKLNAPVIKNADGEPTLIVQNGEYGQFLGELDVVFNEEGVIISHNGRLLDVSTFAEDAKAKEMLASKDAELAEIRQTVVGNTNVELNVNRIIDGKSTRVIRKEETNLGNLIADGVNSTAKELVTKLLSPEELSTIKGFVAIQNGGGIRAGINEGEITLGEVLTVMPFSNSLVALKVTGQEIITSLENGVSGLESDQGRFAQVSGMRYTYDSTKKPEIIHPTTNILEQEGQRIVSVEIKQADGTYTAIDPNAYYILSTNSFMAGGGDFYRALANAKAEGRYYELYLPDYEVFTDYLHDIGTVTIGKESRIVDLKGASLPTPTPVPANPPVGGPVASTPSASPTPSPTTSPLAAPQVTTITAADLTAQLVALPTGSNELVIPVTATTGGAQIVLPGSILVQQAAAKPDTILTFTSTDGTSYSMPLRIVNGAALAAQLGTTDFTITLSIIPADAQILSNLNQAIASLQSSITLAAPVIEFSITAQAGTNSVPLNNFGSTYVERTLTAPTALNSQKASAVVFDPATGKLSFVPSLFEAKTDGTTAVKIKRNSNSFYTVIQSTKTFGDITEHWAKSSIDLLASKLIISGTSNTTFSPSQSITRAEFAALITRSLGLAAVPTETTFKDVSPIAWYAEAIRTASATGLISGYTDGTFKPNSPISRQEMATVLAKAIKFTGKTLNADPTALAKFSDAASIPAWSQAAIAEIAAEGIIQGATDGSFSPQKLATRAEAATMLEKTLKSLKFIN